MSSKRFRIGNDIEVNWTINVPVGDDRLDFEDVNFKVWLVVGSKNFEVTDFTVAGNTISFIYPGSSQVYTGKYMLKVSSLDSSFTYDVCSAFILVRCSLFASEDSGSMPEVNIESNISARSVIRLKGDKGDKGDDGKDGKDGADGKDGKDGADGQDGQDGANGADGATGKSIRVSVWKPNQYYYDGSELVDGIYVFDIVTDKDAAMIGEDDINYYQCKHSHLSSSEETYLDEGLWDDLPNYTPFVTPLVIADKIKAGFIDTDGLVTNELEVRDENDNTLLYAGDTDYPLLAGSRNSANAVTKIDKNGKIYSTDAEISGVINANSGFINGTLKLSPDGMLQTYGRFGSELNAIQLDNTGLYVSWAIADHEDYDIYKMSVGSNNIMRGWEDSAKEYAVFANDTYLLNVVDSLPASPDSKTIYIVTGTGKGVYVGSTQIV